MANSRTPNGCWAIHKSEFLGRHALERTHIVVDFDVNGNVIVDSIDVNVSGAFATTDETVASLYDGGLEEAFAEGTKGDQVGDLTGAVTGVVSEVDGNVFGEADVFIEGRREFVRTEETTLGNLTADANLAVAQSVDDTVMVSIKNAGGIRAPIGEIDGLRANFSRRRKTRPRARKRVRSRSSISRTRCASTTA